MKPSQDTYYMGLAIAEAQKGLGRTSPNPLVGAVIVKDGKVIAKGYHQKAGTPHAEVNAIDSAEEEVKGATIYVTLEPCNHTGRTPPCTRAIIKAGLTRVVIGMLDPNPIVAGGGMRYLQAQGIRVIHGICEHQCKTLNYFFIKHITTGLPWVIMKAGLSLDGKIAYCEGKGGAITGHSTKQYVHTLRDTVDAILVGSSTAIIDNPSLTTRRKGKSPSKDPHRVILDSSLQLAPTCKMLQQESLATTYIYCSRNVKSEKQQALEKAGAVICKVDSQINGKLDIKKILADLGERGVSSILVEGGATVHGDFLKQKCVDQVFLFYAPFFIGGQGISIVGENYRCEGKTDATALKNVTVQQLDQDILLTGLTDEGQAVVSG